MKIKRSLFSLILSVILMLALVIPAAASGNNNAAVYTDNEAFVFPTQPGSAEWKEFQTKQEKLDVCQIPEEKLSAMTTEALLETVLNYPMIQNYLAFNTLEDAFKTIYEDFNGLRALLEREDITEVLLNAYSEADVMTSAQYNLQVNENSENGFIDQFFLTQTVEFLISCDQMESGEYTEEQYKILNTEVSEKEVNRAKSGLYSEGSDIYQKYTSESNASSTVKLMDAGENYSIGYVYTPNGSTVTTLYDRRPELTSAEKNQINTYWATRYSNASYLREPTVKYNCHSYAWYSQSPNNHWIEYPNSYMTDGSYTLYSGTPRIGMKVHYYNGDHSGIVSNTNNGTIYVTSKWGMSGLYTHMLNDCPYTAGTKFYT